MRKKELKAYTLNDAIAMIKNKKGAGKSKKTMLNIQFDFTGDIYQTRMVLEMFNTSLFALGLHIKPNLVITRVLTEMQHNPDWKK